MVGTGSRGESRRVLETGTTAAMAELPSFRAVPRETCSEIRVTVGASDGALTVCWRVLIADCICT